MFNVCHFSASCWWALCMYGRFFFGDFCPSPPWAALASPCFHYESSWYGHHIFFWRALRGARRWFSWQATSVLPSPTVNHTRYWCWGERLSCRSRRGLVFWFPLRYVPSQRLPQKLKTQHPFVDRKIKQTKTLLMWSKIWCPQEMKSLTSLHHQFLPWKQLVN